MAQIPHADQGLDCPLWKKDMSQVCHACPWWIQLRGKHPQSEEEMDRWGCAVGWLPILLIEGAQQTRQAGAAIESFRNEMVQGQAAFVEAIGQKSELRIANSE
jgi:hypothetical protein